MKTMKVGNQELFALRSVNCSMSDKFNRVYKLGANYKELAHKLENFIDVQGLTVRSQCALALKLCLATGMRVGSEESAIGALSIKGNCAYGMTTMLKKFVNFKKDRVIFDFVGKKNVQQVQVVTDKILIKQLKRQYELNDGEELFTISDNDLRAFVKKSVGKNFCVKDFRTLVANLYATAEIKPLLTAPLPVRKSDLKGEIRGVLDRVSAKLGNTPGICKRAYIDPLLMDFLTLKRSK